MTYTANVSLNVLKTICLHLCWIYVETIACTFWGSCVLHSFGSVLVRGNCVERVNSSPMYVWWKRPLVLHPWQAEWGMSLKWSYLFTYLCIILTVQQLGFPLFSSFTALYRPMDNFNKRLHPSETRLMTIVVASGYYRRIMICWAAKLGRQLDQASNMSFGVNAQYDFFFSQNETLTLWSYISMTFSKLGLCVPYISLWFFGSTL